MVGAMTTQKAAAVLGLAVPTLEKMRVRGSGPRYLKLGRSVRYRYEDLEAWLADRVVLSTSEGSNKGSVSLNSYDSE